MWSMRASTLSRESMMLRPCSVRYSMMATRLNSFLKSFSYSSFSLITFSSITFSYDLLLFYFFYFFFIFSTSSSWAWVCFTNLLDSQKETMLKQMAVIQILSCSILRGLLRSKQLLLMPSLLRVLSLYSQHLSPSILLCRQVIKLLKLCLSNIVVICLDPFSPKKPPTTPPIKAPTKGTGMSSWPSDMPAIADPIDPTAVTEALPICFIFALLLVASFLKVWQKVKERPPAIKRQFMMGISERMQFMEPVTTAFFDKSAKKPLASLQSLILARHWPRVLPMLTQVPERIPKAVSSLLRSLAADLGSSDLMMSYTPFNCFMLGFSTFQGFWEILQLVAVIAPFLLTLRIRLFSGFSLPSGCSTMIPISPLVLTTLLSFRSAPEFLRQFIHRIVCSWWCSSNFCWLQISGLALMRHLRVMESQFSTMYLQKFSVSSTGTLRNRQTLSISCASSWAFRLVCFRIPNRRNEFMILYLSIFFSIDFISFCTISLPCSQLDAISYAMLFSRLASSCMFLLSMQSSSKLKPGAEGAMSSSMLSSMRRQTLVRVSGKLIQMTADSDSISSLLSSYTQQQGAFARQNAIMVSSCLRASEVTSYPVLVA